LLTQLKLMVPLKPGTALRVSPIARVPPGDTVGAAPGFPPGGGVIVRTNGTVVTVSVVAPTMFVFPCALVAEMVVFAPAVKPVARPPAVMEAAAVFDEAHTTDPVRSCMLWSENVPVAVNCWFCPTTTVGFVGVTAMETSTTGAVTVNCDAPLIAGVCVEVAVIVTGPPAVTPVARPVAASIVAMAVFPEDHVTATGPVDPSEKCPVAANACVNPATMEVVAGATVMDCSVTVPDVNVPVTIVSCVIVNAQVPVPEHGALQPVKEEPVSAVAVKINGVPVG
jgi:hypothetical protein